MDRRSWLWRRKSSEKSPSGETESSGSLSSHSERFSDDQTLSNPNTQSPEVTSKAAPGDELNDGVKTLSAKLSEALLNISAKEELVKQHAKVAEEAVSGWERAENEVLVLKKQNDALIQKNSILEERVGQLDGALKECLRELRQAREEQQEKIYEALAKKNSEWESKKSELENQLVELQTELENAKTDALTKLEAAGKENSILKLKLLSKTEELERRTNERDLSTHAAETASKQHLDSIKKVAKLEAECRRLKVVVRKANDHRSVYAESCADSQSENGSSKVSGLESIENSEMGQFTHERILGRSLIAPSVEIDLMDDFLEMERIAALPVMSSGGPQVNGGEARLRDELEAMITRTTELEENLRKITAEKESLEIALNGCQIQLKTSEDQLNQTEMKLVDLKMQLAMANEEKRDAQKELESTKMKLKNTSKLLDEAEMNMAKIQDQLREANETKSVIEVQLKKELGSTKTKLKNTSKLLDEAETNMVQIQDQLRESNETRSIVEVQLKKEFESTKLELKNTSKRLDEAETNMAQIQDQLREANEMKSIFEVQLKDANLKKAEAESQLKVRGVELDTLRSSICTLEKEVEKERRFSKEAVAQCDVLEFEISRMKSDSQYQRSAFIEEFRINQDKELAVAASKFADCQKTIASLSHQLKSLATFEDILIDSERPVAVL